MIVSTLEDIFYFMGVLSAKLKSSYTHFKLVRDYNETSNCSNKEL